MDIQTAIAILETKKLSCCSQKEFVQAADMAIDALRQQVQNNTNALQRSEVANANKC